MARTTDRRANRAGSDRRIATARRAAADLVLTHLARVELTGAAAYFAQRVNAVWQNTRGFCLGIAVALPADVCTLDIDWEAVHAALLTRDAETNVLHAEDTLR